MTDARLRRATDEGYETALLGEPTAAALRRRVCLCGSSPLIGATDEPRLPLPLCARTAGGVPVECPGQMAPWARQQHGGRRVEANGMAGTYFADNSSRLSLNPSGDLPIRDPQRGALHAIAAHFTQHHSPAIVALPTGVGKTLVAAAAPYLLGEPGRVLIVVPSRVLREQTTAEMGSQEQLFRYDTLEEGPAPVVRELTRRLDDWAEVEDADVVVSIPTCVSPATLTKANKPVPRADFFSVVIVDEAHHVPADTWTALVDHFDTAKCIFLTATPFRRDKRTIPGEVVYHYRLRRAVEDGAYAPVIFHGVQGAGKTERQRDIDIRDLALERLGDKTHENSALLVRGGSIARTKELVELYAQSGADIEFVHSDLSPATVRRRLEKVKNGEVAGVAFIGVLGEGFDCPNLKVGALHDKHKSLPITLQFIGRLTRRAPGVAAEAELVATNEDLRASTWGLWRHSAVWDELLPDLADSAVDAVSARKSLLDQFPEFDNPDVSRMDLEPRRKAVVYEHEHDGAWSPVIDEAFTTANGLAKGDMFAMGEIVYSAALPDQGFLVLVTAHRQHPPWMSSRALDGVGYELHTLALEPSPPNNSRYIFIVSNTRRNEHELAAIITGTEATQLVDSDVILRYADSVDMRSMHNLGLRSTSTRGRGQRAYTNVAGSAVDRSVLDSDRRGNHLGHGMGVGENLPGSRRGAVTFSVGKGRINETPTGDLAEYLQWVREVSTIMRGDTPAAHLALVPGLAVEHRVAAWPTNTRLVHVEPDHENADHRQVAGFGDIRLLELTATPDPTKPTDLMAIEGHIEGKQCLKAQMRPTGIFAPNNETNSSVLTDGARIPLSTYLEEHPPRFYFADGSSICGGRQADGGTEELSLPPQLLRGLAWRNVDIKREAAKSQPAGCIHEYVERLLRHLHPNAWIVLDDGKGELADHLVIEPSNNENDATLTLVHSKYSTKVTPGQRVADLDEVLNQAVRSRRWIQDGSFFWEEMARRLQRRTYTKVLTGAPYDKASLLVLCNRWHVSPPVPTVHVVIAQPGLSIPKFERGMAGQQPGTEAYAVAESLHAANTWITTSTSSLTVLGHR